MQDKRSVVPIEPEDVEMWRHAPGEEAVQLVRLAPVELSISDPAVA